MALLSHPLATTFPALVLILIWWERGKLKRPDMVPLIPFALMALALAVAAAALNFIEPASCGSLFPASKLDRRLGSRRLVVFLAIILPIHLSFAYSRWTSDSIALWQWIFPIAAGFVVCGAVDIAPPLGPWAHLRGNAIHLSAAAVGIGCI